MLTSKILTDIKIKGHNKKEIMAVELVYYIFDP